MPGGAAPCFTLPFALPMQNRAGRGEPRQRVLVLRTASVWISQHFVTAVPLEQRVHAFGARVVKPPSALAQDLSLCGCKAARACCGRRWSRIFSSVAATYGVGTHSSSRSACATTFSRSVDARRLAGSLNPWRAAPAALANCCCLFKCSSLCPICLLLVLARTRRPPRPREQSELEFLLTGCGSLQAAQCSARVGAKFYISPCSHASRIGRPLCSP